MKKMKFALLLAPCLAFPAMSASPMLAQANHNAAHGQADHDAKRFDWRTGFAQAMADLRWARANMEGHFSPDVTPPAQRAVKDITDAYNTIKQAALEDHQDPNHQPPVDTSRKPNDRFQDAIAALDKARGDVARQAGDAKAEQERQHALSSIDSARKNVQEAMDRASRETGKAEHSKR